jgi:hypothetical protein
MLERVPQRPSVTCDRRKKGEPFWLRRSWNEAKSHVMKHPDQGIVKARSAALPEAKA